MKASRAAVRQIKALERMAIGIVSVETKLNWLIANLQASNVLPDTPDDFFDLARSGDITSVGSEATPEGSAVRPTKKPKKSKSKKPKAGSKKKAASKKK